MEVETYLPSQVCNLLLLCLSTNQLFWWLLICCLQVNCFASVDLLTGPQIPPNRLHFPAGFDFGRLPETLWKWIPKRCPKSNQKRFRWRPQKKAKITKISSRSHPKIVCSKSIVKSSQKYVYLAIWSSSNQWNIAVVSRHVVQKIIEDRPKVRFQVYFESMFC